MNPRTDYFPLSKGIQMAGQPGKSGGARQGAGRKRKEPVLIAENGSDSPLKQTDPQVFLLGVMNDPMMEARMRIDAAKALMPFMHLKLGEGGKKDQKSDAAKQAGAGKFGASAPPKLVVNNKQQR